MLSIVDIKVKKAADGIIKFAETLAATLEGSKNDVNSTSHFPSFISSDRSARFRTEHYFDITPLVLILYRIFLLLRFLAYFLRFCASKYTTYPAFPLFLSIF